MLVTSDYVKIVIPDLIRDPSFKNNVKAWMPHQVQHDRRKTSRSPASPSRLSFLFSFPASRLRSPFLLFAPSPTRSSFLSSLVSPVSVLRLPVSLTPHSLLPTPYSLLLPITYYLLPTLPTTYSTYYLLYLLPTTYYLLPTTHSLLLPLEQRAVTFCSGK